MKLIDFHCDTILRLVEGGENVGLKQNDFSVDIGKLREGNVIAQFFACYVDLANDGNPLEYCLAMIDRFYRELEANQAEIALATCYRDLVANQAAGKISAFLTIEEGGVLKGKLENLRIFHRLGVRLITLTWNYPNEIGFPNTLQPEKDKGLTQFGRELVEAMNRMGMLVDVSHLSDRGFYDVAQLSTKPFVASHSNARAITAHARNLTDDMIRVLAEKGGITGLNFSKNFLGSSEISRIEDMVRHVKHIYSIGGIEAVAIGTDFDGIQPRQEVANSGEMGKLVRGLEKAGFNTSEIEKMYCKNALRVIKDALG